MTDASAAFLLLWVTTVPGAMYTREHLPLRLAIENTGAAEVRLLRHFEPLPVFFAIDLTRADGTPIGIPGAGKIDFYAGQIEYLVLRQHEFFGVEFDLATVLPSTAELPPGDYTLSATYHNQYGEDCFQGELRSNSIELTIR